MSRGFRLQCRLGCCHVSRRRPPHIASALPQECLALMKLITSSDSSPDRLVPEPSLRPHLELLMPSYDNPNKAQDYAPKTPQDKNDSRSCLTLLGGQQYGRDVDRCFWQPCRARALLHEFKQTHTRVCLDPYPTPAVSQLLYGMADLL